MHRNLKNCKFPLRGLAQLNLSWLISHRWGYGQLSLLFSMWYPTRLKDESYIKWRGYIKVITGHPQRRNFGKKVFRKINIFVTIYLGYDNFCSKSIWLKIFWWEMNQNDFDQKNFLTKKSKFHEKQILDKNKNKKTHKLCLIIHNYI